VYLLMQNTKGVNDKISVHLWKTIYHQLKILFSVADWSNYSGLHRCITKMQG
jgi:hypothetical protein